MTGIARMNCTDRQLVYGFRVASDGRYLADRVMVSPECEHSRGASSLDGIDTGDEITLMYGCEAPTNFHTLYLARLDKRSLEVVHKVVLATNHPGSYSGVDAHWYRSGKSLLLQYGSVTTLITGENLVMTDVKLAGLSQRVSVTEDGWLFGRTLLGKESLLHLAQDGSVICEQPMTEGAFVGRLGLGRALLAVKKTWGNYYSLATAFFSESTCATGYPGLAVSYGDSSLTGIKHFVPLSQDFVLLDPDDYKTGLYLIPATGIWKQGKEVSDSTTWGSYIIKPLAAGLAIIEPYYSGGLRFSVQRISD